jgi:hypothetical protein
MMSERAAWILLAGLAWDAGNARAAECDEGFVREVSGVTRVIESLKLDKPGQARVFATDGTEFTGGQALWLKGQLRAIERACERGDREAASRRLPPLVELVLTRQASRPP